MHECCEREARCCDAGGHVRECELSNLTHVASISRVCGKLYSLRLSRLPKAIMERLTPLASLLAIAVALMLVSVAPRRQ